MSAAVETLDRVAEAIDARQAENQRRVRDFVVKLVEQSSDEPLDVAAALAKADEILAAGFSLKDVKRLVARAVRRREYADRLAALERGAIPSSVSRQLSAANAEAAQIDREYEAKRAEVQARIQKLSERYRGAVQGDDEERRHLVSYLKWNAVPGTDVRDWRSFSLWLQPGDSAIPGLPLCD